MNSLLILSICWTGLSVSLIRANPKACPPLIGCKCLISDQSVSCGLGTTDTALHMSFNGTAVRRVVDRFDLSDNNNITRIPNYFSRNVSFVNINIRNVKSLSAIEENAFWSSVNTTKTFRLTSSSVNSSQTLFKAISKLVHLTELVLDDNQIETIPDYAFGEHQEHLDFVVLTRNRIRHLGEYPFYHLYSLTYLDLSDNIIDKLVNNSLAIKNKEKEMFPHNIRINLKINQISYISDHAFDNLKRPTNLDISFNNLTELRPQIFKSFINYEMSKVIVRGNKVKCDCGINWIYSNRSIKSKFSGPIRCADKRYFADLTPKDFKNCTK